MLSLPLFTVYWIDSHSRVGKSVNVGSCRINRLLLADDLVLLASSYQVIQHMLERFAIARNQAGMKIRTKKTEVLCPPETQVSE